MRPATWEEVNGTAYRGSIFTTYDKIVSILGEPHYTDPDPYAKWNCEWAVMTDEGVAFTLYNWKDGHTPTEEYGWHVGGKDMNSLWAAMDIIGDALDSGSIKKEIDVPMGKYEGMKEVRYE